MARTRFDMANEKMSFRQIVSDIDYELIAGFGMNISGGDVTPWDPYVGSGGVPEDTSAGPEYDETDVIDGRPVVLWTGIGERSKKAPDDLLSEGGDFGIICIWRVADSSARCVFSWSDDTGSVTPTNRGAVALYSNVTAGRVQMAHVNTAGTDVYATDIVATGTNWHVSILSKVGTTIRLVHDGRTAATGTVSGAIVADRLTLGAQKIGATHFYPHNGGLRQLARRRGGGFSTDEETAIYQLAKIIAPSIA